MTKKLLFLIISLSLIICFAFSVGAESSNYQANRLRDEADLLNSADETELENKLNEISERLKVDIIIATVETTSFYTTDEFVNKYYDRNLLGYGENRDGVMLLIVMDTRDYRILSNGVGANAISKSDIDSISAIIQPSLSKGSYLTAFSDFLDECEYEINGEINGFPFNFKRNIVIALIVGFLIAFIVTGAMKGQLKSVRRQPSATQYTKAGSMNLTRANDFFLYRTIHRRPRANNNASRGSSGGSRNVGGGRF